MRATDLIKEIDPSRSPWTQSGKHPGAMNREELEREIAVFDELKRRGDHLSPKEIMQLDSLYHYLHKTNEGWARLPDMDREKYQPRDGLEGPIMTRSGKVVYYDNVEGKYYDPDTDMYLTYDEWKAFDPELPIKTEDDFDAKGLEGKALMQLYKDNEHNNQHSENNLLLAKAFGTPKEVKMVELIIAKNRQQGYTDTMDGEWMYHNINKKYYPQLVKGALGESYGIIVGMNSEDKDEQDNKTKAQVKNKKPYAKTESIFDE